MSNLYKNIRLQTIIIAIMLITMPICMAKADCVDCDIAPTKDFEIESLQELKFGKVIVSNSGNSSIDIDPRTSYKTLTGGAVDMGGVYGPAVFEVSGNTGDKFNILVTGLVKMNPVDQRVTITNIRRYPTGILELDNTKKATFSIGGTLNLPASPNPGEYEAGFNVFATKIVE